jgi:large subunit ribosomal protein L17
MAHRISQKKLSRPTKERNALLKNLAKDLVLHERIVTTTARAKAVSPFVERLITRAKEDTLTNRRYLATRLRAENVVRKLIELVGPTFKERPGGYTRIIRLLPRVGDSANMAVLEFVENVSEVAAKKKLEEKTTKEKAPKAKKVKDDEAAERKEDQKLKKSTKNSKIKANKTKK